jgi:hypothetical protein
VFLKAPDFDFLPCSSCGRCVPDKLENWRCQGSIKQATAEQEDIVSNGHSKGDTSRGALRQRRSCRHIWGECPDCGSDLHADCAARAVHGLNLTRRRHQFSGCGTLFPRIVQLSQRQGGHAALTLGAEIHSSQRIISAARLALCWEIPDVMQLRRIGRVAMNTRGCERWYLSPTYGQKPVGCDQSQMSISRHTSTSNNSNPALRLAA